MLSEPVIPEQLPAPGSPLDPWILLDLVLEPGQRGLFWSVDLGRYVLVFRDILGEAIVADAATLGGAAPC